jgi:N-acetylneuraminate synthase
MAKFIAEIGSNHNGSWPRTMQLMLEAKNVGCDGVKFQCFEIDRMFAPEVLAKSEEHRKRRAWELAPEQIRQCAGFAHAHDLEFGCSVYDIETIAEIADVCDFLKISSYDILRLDLIKACAETGKPLVVSTGMATYAEIDAAVAAIGDETRTHTFLHCVSAYPAPAKHCALAGIDELRVYDHNVGWSDHSRDPRIVARAAILHKSHLIEFHLDLEDGAGWEYGDHCWKPSQIAPVITCCAKPPGLFIKPAELEESPWRADPSDGLRPMLSERSKL